LILLDDCFSGLDSKTESLVFSRLLGSQGLLKRLGCTIVLATHAVRYVYEADELLILGQRGTIKSHGNIEHLRLTDQYVRDNLKDVKQIDQDDNALSDEPIAEYIQQPPDSEAQDAARQSGDFAIYGYYFKQISLLNLAIFVLFNCIYVFCTRFSQVWVEYWVNAEARNPSSRTSAIYGVSYLALSLGALSFFGVTLLFMFQVMVPKTAQKMHWGLLQTTIHASYSFLSAVDPGTTLNRFSQDMTLLDLELPSYAVQFSFYLFSWFGQTILIIMGVKYIAALIPPIVVIVYILQKCYLRTSRQVRYLDLEAKAPLYSHMLETYSGLHSVRAFGWERRFLNMNLLLLDGSQRPFYALFCIQRWLNLVLALIVGAIAVAVVAFATQIRNVTSGNEIGVALINIVNLAQTLAMLITSYTSLETSMGAVARLKSFITEVEPEDEPTLKLNPPAAGKVYRGKIEFKNITAAYKYVFLKGRKRS